MKKPVIKKLCILALVLCLISGHVSVYASAVTGADDPGLFQFEQMPPTEILKKYVDPAELRAYLFEALKECSDERIELSQFNIPDESTAKQALSDFIYREMPESFQVYHLKYKLSKGIVTALIADYRYAETKDEYLSMLSECEERAAVLLEGIKGNNNLSDAEKALLIHDRLAVNCNYCSNSASSDGCTIYDALVRREAVCDGYSRTYAYLLRLVGIESINCSSESLDHSWNLVLIDGNYYHADVTWDDPICYTNERKGHEGYVRHNFLLSDQARKAFIESKGYKPGTYNDYFDTLATSTKYDNYYWQVSETEFQLIGDQLYYFDNKAATLNRVKSDKKSGTVVLTKTDTWWASDRSYYWDDNFTRLGSNGEVLFLSTSDTIYLYDPEYDLLTEAFKPGLVNGNQIYGFTFSEGYFVCDTGSVPTGYSSADNVLITERYTPKKIFATLTYTSYTTNYQIVTANIISENGISGYYFGTDPDYSKTEIIASTKATQEFTVTKPGVYYFAAYDAEGEVSEVLSLTFYLVALDPNGGVVECDKIIAEYGCKIILPTPEKEGYTFSIWEDKEKGLIVDSLEKRTFDYYKSLYLNLTASWIIREQQQEQQSISGKVQTSSSKENISIAVRLVDADGNVLETAAPENGVFNFTHTGQAAYVEITAPGRVGKRFKADAMPDMADGEIILDLLGDMDNDDEVNNKDVTGIFRFLSDPNNDYSDVVDVNGDNENNNKDVVFLFRFLSDPNASLITHIVNMFK